jgi:hypothetical protein
MGAAGFFSSETKKRSSHKDCHGPRHGNLCGYYYYVCRFTHNRGNQHRPRDPNCRVTFWVTPIYLAMYVPILPTRSGDAKSLETLHHRRCYTHLGSIICNSEGDKKR